MRVETVTHSKVESAPPRFLARRLWYSVSNAQHSEVGNFKPLPPRYETGRSGTDKTINGKPCKAISAGIVEVAPDTNQGFLKWDKMKKKLRQDLQ